MKTLSKPNSWGGEIEIFCLSEIYKIKIEVFNFDPTSMTVHPLTTYRADAENEYSIRLMYYNEFHYWPLIEATSTISSNSSYEIECVEIIEEEVITENDNSFETEMIAIEANDESEYFDNVYVYGYAKLASLSA